VVAAVGLAGHVAAEPARSESLASNRADRGRWPAVTARAVAPLAELIELALPLLTRSGILLAWKRGVVDDPAGLGGEVAAARRALDAIDPGGRIEIVAAVPAGSARVAALGDLADHRLVIVERGTGPIAGGWPRDPATRRRAPW
jgi:hypothetical protein